MAALASLVDRFDRVHSDLRISVTDRCNIRCFYCMPEEGAQFTPNASLLSLDQIVRFLEAVVPLGIRKVRLTGGEPLLRPQLPELVARIAKFSAIDDLALTTNGVVLERWAKPLYDAGLRRLNLHLDTLDRHRFAQLTRRDDLPRVLAGLDAAQTAGFRNIKINAVALKGVSETDLPQLVRFGRERGIEVRFIEIMPLDGQRLWSGDNVLTADAMIRLLSAEFGPLTAVPGADPRAPATTYRFADGYKVGFIASVSRPFCANCNRLRLTADGKLRNCLFARDETDIRHLLAPGTPAFAIQDAVRESVRQKWAGHDIQQVSFIAPARPMYAIGG